VQSAGASIKAEIASILAALRQAAQSAASLRAQASGGSSDDGSSSDFSFRTAGAVRGRGTGTSDSIFARLSNGEFVLRADVVRRVGLPFLNAMKLPGFADGGLVDFGGALPNIASAFSVPNYLRALPSSFAASGISSAPARSGTPVHLHLPGGTSFEMMADSAVAGKLASYLRRKSFTSLGAAPSWQGNR
jgi:hypothetical protein